MNSRLRLLLFLSISILILSVTVIAVPRLIVHKPSTFTLSISGFPSEYIGSLSYALIIYAGINLDGKIRYDGTKLIVTFDKIDDLRNVGLKNNNLGLNEIPTINILLYKGGKISKVTKVSLSMLDLEILRLLTNSNMNAISTDTLKRIIDQAKSHIHADKFYPLRFGQINIDFNILTNMQESGVVDAVNQYNLTSGWSIELFNDLASALNLSLGTQNNSSLNTHSTARQMNRHMNVDMYSSYESIELRTQYLPYCVGETNEYWAGETLGFFKNGNYYELYHYYNTYNPLWSLIFERGLSSPPNWWYEHIAFSNVDPEAVGYYYQKTWDWYVAYVADAIYLLEKSTNVDDSAIDKAMKRIVQEISGEWNIQFVFDPELLVDRAGEQIIVPRDSISWVSTGLEGRVEADYDFPIFALRADVVNVDEVDALKVHADVIFDLDSFTATVKSSFAILGIPLWSVTSELDNTPPEAISPSLETIYESEGYLIVTAPAVIGYGPDKAVVAFDVIDIVDACNNEYYGIVPYLAFTPVTTLVVDYDSLKYEFTDNGTLFQSVYGRAVSIKEYDIKLNEYNTPSPPPIFLYTNSENVETSAQIHIESSIASVISRTALDALIASTSSPVGVFFLKMLDYTLSLHSVDIAVSRDRVEFVFQLYIDGRFYGSEGIHVRVYAPKTFTGEGIELRSSLLVTLEKPSGTICKSSYCAQSRP